MLLEVERVCFHHCSCYVAQRETMNLAVEAMKVAITIAESLLQEGFNSLIKKFTCEIEALKAIELYILN